jgi:Flp pilus assembly pilin Flp
VLIWTVAATLGCVALRSGARRFLDAESLMRVPFHADESLHLAQADLYDLFFLRRDWHNPKWFDDYYGPDQPHWGHYLIGWHLSRRGLARPVCQFYDFDITFAENRQAGAVPSARSLLAARQLMGLLAMGTLAGIVLLGFATGHPLVGAIAANLLAANFLFQYSMSRAMLEAPLLFGCTATVLLAVLAWRGLRSTSRGAVAIGYALIVPVGLALGMVAGTKLLGGVTAVFWVLLMASLWAEPALRTRRLWKRPVIGVVLAGLVALPFFYLTNPYLFSYPNKQAGARLGLFGGIKSMLDHAAFRQAAQQWIYDESAIIDPTRRIKLTLAKIFVSRVPPRFPTASNLAEGDLPAMPFAGLEDSGKGDIFQPPGSYATIGRRAWIPWDALLALVGLGFLGFRAVRHYRARARLEPGIVLVLWFGVTFVATCWWLPLDWDRYYLLGLSAAQLLIAAGIVAPVEWLLQRRLARR